LTGGAEFSQKYAPTIQAAIAPHAIRSGFRCMLPRAMLELVTPKSIEV